GLFDGPPASSELRQRLETEAGTCGTRALHDRLAQVDAVTAARLHPNDQRRIIRALEVWELTGRPISAWQTQWGSQRTEDSGQRTEDGQPESVLLCPLSSVLWLNRPRPELYARINERVERMITSGLVDEVRALRQTRQPISREAAQALGYKEVFAH